MTYTPRWPRPTRGVRLIDLLDERPTERPKYVPIGASTLITAAMVHGAHGVCPRHGAKLGASKNAQTRYLLDENDADAQENYRRRTFAGMVAAAPFRWITAASRAVIAR